MSGRVVHFELPADNVERAEAFYRDTFGWEMQTMAGMGYTLVKTTPEDENGPKEPGGINGGMLARQAPITAPVITIEVDDIGAALIEVEKGGGRTVRASEAVGVMGFAAYFQDPEGNIVGLWEHARR